jgi:membrane protease YdiL (CAAX protease family)
LSIYSRQTDWHFERLSGTEVGFHCVLVPFVEESMFRGIMLNSLLERYSWPLSVCISAIIFASVHTSFTVGLIGGLAFGLLYVHGKRSLAPSLVAHVMANLLINLAPHAVLLV